jgi:thiol-disulfide isomerase/thioredoxin
MTFALIPLIARLVLAGVFAVAGAAKLADRAGARTAVVAFGTPERIAAPVALVLPLVELAVAALLLPAAPAVAGLIGAVALLALFTGAIAASLARGKAPDCHCFGQLHSAPAGRRTLARNGGLLALGIAGLAGSVVHAPESAVAWLRDLSGSELLALVVGLGAAIVVAAGAAAFLTLMRSYGTVLVRLDRLEAALADAGIDLAVEEGPRIGLEPGSPAPWFLAVTTEGTGVSRDDLLAPGLPLLLLFTSPHCGPCAELLPEAAQWQRDHADDLTVAFACTGEAEAVDAEASEFALDRVLVDESSAIAESCEATGTPAAVLVNADGTLASWVAMGRDAIVTLLAQALASSPSDGGLPAGAPAPDLELPTLDGELMSLEALRGQETVLVFWNPSCGFCRSMHDDLLAFERDAEGSEPRLVVVSSGGEEETRAEGFRSTVLVDGEYAAGTAFGAAGTPMAVRLDADGRVASPVAAGAEAVLELAGQPVRRVAVGGA